LGRLDLIASCAVSFDKARAKLCVREALNMCSTAIDIPNMSERHRSLTGC